jgi:O-antigen/teichoic acid export membrane protein
MASVRRSLSFSFAENYTAMVLSFISTLFIARLLSPAEIGTFSIGVVLVGISHIVRDFGVGRYIIQEKDLTPDRIRAAFAVTLIFAWGLAALLAIISTPVAEYYRTPGVAAVIQVLAGNFLLLPFGSITMAYLRREMNFAASYWIRTLAGMAHAATGIGLAFLGFSYMSLAWAATSGVVVTVLASAYFRPKGMPWLPGSREIKRVLSFGSYASGASVAGEIGTAAPELIIGKALDIGAVAIFGRAISLITLFNRMVTRSIWSVALPYFSMQLRSGRNLKEGYLRVTAYITGVAWPFYVFLALMAYPTVRILFGAQWDASVPLVRVLCVSALFSVTIAAYGDFILAHGEAKTLSKLTFTTVLLKVLAILAAAPFGLLAVAVSLVLVTVVSIGLILPTFRRLAGITHADLARAVKKSFGVTVFSSVGPLSIVLLMGLEPENVWLSIASAGISAAAGWVAGIFAVKHELADEVKTVICKVSAAVRSRPK